MRLALFHLIKSSKLKMNDERRRKPLYAINARCAFLGGAAIEQFTDRPLKLSQKVVSPKSKLTRAIRKPKATWVEPMFYADVEYRDIASEGLLRASSFKRLSK
jgi:hypothetical protein